jgi:hypothetical protein
MARRDARGSDRRAADEQDAFAALREAIDAFAIEQAPTLVAEARAEALARARRMLSDAMVESLLDESASELAAARGSAVDDAPRTQPRKRARAPERRAEEPHPRREKAESPEAERGGEAGEGCYVYGVARATEAELPEGLAGVDPEHPAMLIGHGGLAAIASRVSLSEFGEDELRENLNDLEWLEEKARAHEQVLAEALARMTLVPMRLCTIYSSESHVREMLDREHEIFMEALGRLEGKTEWGVKLIAEPGAVDRAADSSGKAQIDDEGDVTEGVAYLRERGRENRARELGTEIAEQWASEAHELLASRAFEALCNPLQNPELSGETGEMLLNGVYLVEDGDIDDFREAVDDLNTRFGARDVRAELTGPWPPYNFVKGWIEAAR